MRRHLLLLAAGVLAVAGLTWTGGPATAASTLGLDKSASVTTTQPGQDFTYTLVPRCSGLTEACINAAVVDVLPPEIEVTALPASDAERLVTFDPATRTLRIEFRIPLPPPSPAGSVGLPAGSSRNIQLGVRVPTGSTIADGTTVTNSATVTADNAPAVPASADVEVEVPRVVTPVATKSWTDGSAVAGSHEASTVTLQVRNASSSTAEVFALEVDDSTPAVYDRFDVTGIGPVTFPPGADRVSVRACTLPASACGPDDYASTGPQTGPGIVLPPGVAAGDVTGLQFVFTASGGGLIPTSPTAGSVQVSLSLRDTIRSTGDPYRPTTRDDVNNCATPLANDAQLGEVSGVLDCATYAVQPAQATMSVNKTFFSDTNADYVANGQAVDGESSLVSGLVRATNTSPFAVSQMTISEPAISTPSEFGKFDLSNVRVVFPAGATRAQLDFDCAGIQVSVPLVPPPGTVDVPVPCQSGVATGVLLTFSGTDADGNGTIASGATGTLGVQGRLNGNVTPDDLVGGPSAGVQNCASGTATSSIDGVGSAAAAGCASVAVQPAFSNVTGVKTAQLPTILPGLPRAFTLSFTNRGTIPATNVVLADPPDPTAPGNPFDQLRLASLTLPASPAATAEVYDPQVGSYVPYAAGDADLLARARGFRVSLAGPLAAGASYSLTAQVLLRDNVPIGTRIQNCATIGSDTQPATPFCSGAVTATEPSEGASVQKLINPASSTHPQPGLPGTPVQVKLAAQNTGTLWLKRLVVTDVDADFYDAVDVTGQIRVNFPPSANRVQVDACTTDCAGGTFVQGTPTASQTPSLPAGVAAADVRGLRITFSVADGSFTIKPGANWPATGPCTGASVCITVVPRATLHSDPGTRTPDVLSDTASGGYETTRQGGALAPIPDTTATHTLDAGSAQLLFAKSSDASAGPGDTISFTLSITNTGTGPLPDPVIAEPLPQALDFAPSDPLAPYTFTINQPAGAPASPDPAFTTTQDAGGSVRSLRWSFDGLVLLPGGSVSVTFLTQLAPGVTAGSTILNRAGGSADRPDRTCATGAPRPGTAVDDPAYGDGLFCTSAAAVTTLSGNAIATAKWVAGDETLGWLNSVTGEHLPVADPSCPRLTVAGTAYTRYPCVARVAPGQGFDFYLRVTNAGTNPATEVRVVDVFPAPGDTGVILTGEDRGTQWNESPTLLGPVTLDGPGALAASYTTDVPACTTDLNRPPVACAAGDWDAAFAPASTAFRGLLTFGQGLAPGGSTALRFRMVAPAAPVDPTQDQVAWNSFAHTEFFADNGRTVQLPATEPIKTGVALVFGDIRAVKVVTGSAEDGPFGFAYRCTVTPETQSGPGAPVVVAEGTFQLGAGGELVRNTIPARATCRVWETDAAGLVSDAFGEANAKSVTVPVGGVEAVPTVRITNAAAPASPSPTATSTGSPTSSPTPSPTKSPTRTPSTTGTASPTGTSGGTPSSSASGSPSGSPSASPTDTGGGGGGGTGLPPTGASASLLPMAVAGVLLLLLGGVLLLSLRTERLRRH